MIIKKNKGSAIIEAVLILITTLLFGGILVSLAAKAFGFSDNQVKSKNAVECGVDDVLKEECKDKVVQVEK